MNGLLWAVIALAAVLIGTAVTVRWLYCVVAVAGSSLEPELAPGDRLLARRCGVRGLRLGQFVIIREPGLTGRHRRPVWLTGAGQDVWVVKRVAALPGDRVPATVRRAAGTAVVPPRTLVALGDRPDSRDSRQWGLIPASSVLGVCSRKLTQLGTAKQGPAAASGEPGPTS
jgi:signal peptidase I